MNENLADALSLLVHREALVAQLIEVAREPEEPIRQVRTIQALIYYLGKIDVPAALTAPLLSIAGNIADGIEHDNRKPLVESQIWAACAAAVDMLKEMGTPLGEALKLVAKAAGGKLDVKQLGEFRRNVSKKRARPEAKAFYHSCISRNRELFGPLPPEERKMRLLQSIRVIGLSL